MSFVHSPHPVETSLEATAPPGDLHGLRELESPSGILSASEHLEDEAEEPRYEKYTYHKTIYSHSFTCIYSLGPIIGASLEATASADLPGLRDSPSGILSETEHTADETEQPRYGK